VTNPAVAAAAWRDFAEVTVELGPVRTWVPSGSEWGNVARTTAADYRAAISASAPIRYWPLDSPSALIGSDLQGNAAFGVNDPWGAPAAAHFNGTTDVLVDSGAAMVAPLTTTVECWYQTASTASAGLVMFEDTQGGPSGARDRELFMLNVLSAFIYSAGNVVAVDTLRSSDGQWHHAAATYDGATLTLYRDGVAVGTASGGPDVLYSGWFRIGQSTQHGYYSGNLCQCAIYDRALPASEILGHFDAAGAPAGGRWGVDHWGSQYLTPSEWLDVTGDVLSLDTDTGRNGLDDPGEVGTASLTLDDRTGTHGIAGKKGWVGALLRVTTKHVASGARNVTFLGKVTEDHAEESLVNPAISISAVDLLGSVLSTDDTEPLPAQSVRERLDALLDRAGFPGNKRVLDDDVVALLAVDKAGSRIDAARGAASSSTGGTLFARADTIVYRHGAANLDPDAVPRFSIGTVEGAVCPGSLKLAEQISKVLNVYVWANGTDDTALTASASNADSIHAHGRMASVRTDVLNARVDELDELVRAELARTAWPDDAVDGCEIPVHDHASAELVLAQLGDLCTFQYSGSDPWSSYQVVGSIAHHIAPDAWTIDLKAFAPEIGSLWGVAKWGISAWSRT
jgi:hypothetical protein